MHMIKFNDIWEQKLFPLLIVRGWKYRRGGENIVTIFSPRGEDIVGVEISSHTGTFVCPIEYRSRNKHRHLHLFNAFPLNYIAFDSGTMRSRIALLYALDI